MKLEYFLSLEISEKVKIASEPYSLKDPFWLERLKTAVQQNSPIALIFSQELKDIYWQIKKHK